jgi:lysophospholipase L1-like esterase
MEVKMMVRRVLAIGAVAAMTWFLINLVWVIFFGGIHLKIGETYVRSTKIEFPVFGLLASLFIWLLARGKAKESVLVGLSLIVSLGFGEVALRIIDHPLSRPVIDFNRWYEPSELYGHQLVKNFEGPGPLHVPVKINSVGFRDAEHARTKDVGTIRILGLGDSFTFGWGVALEQTFLKQLEVRLQHVTDRPVEVFNIAVPGWGLNQYYIALREFGVAYQPDLVIVGYWTDDLNGPPVDKLGAVPNSTWEGERQAPLRGGTLHHLRIFNFFYHLADDIKYRNRSKRIPHLHDVQARRAEWTTRPNYLISDPGPEATEKYGKQLRDHLSRIDQLVAENGAALVVVLIPDYSQLFHPEFQHINRVMKTTTDALGIPLIDMTPLYEATEETQPNYLWPLDGHTNQVGHKAIADVLLPAVCSLLKNRNVPCGIAAAGS